MSTSSDDDLGGDQANSNVIEHLQSTLQQMLDRVKKINKDKLESDSIDNVNAIAAIERELSTVCETGAKEFSLLQKKVKQSAKRSKLPGVRKPKKTNKLELNGDDDALDSADDDGASTSSLKSKAKKDDAQDSRRQSKRIVSRGSRKSSPIISNDCDEDNSNNVRKRSGRSKASIEINDKKKDRKSKTRSTSPQVSANQEDLPCDNGKISASHRNSLESDDEVPPVENNDIENDGCDDINRSKNTSTESIKSKTDDKENSKQLSTDDVEMDDSSSKSPISSLVREQQSTASSTEEVDQTSNIKISSVKSLAVQLNPLPQDLSSLLIAYNLKKIRNETKEFTTIDSLELKSSHSDDSQQSSLLMRTERKSDASEKNAAIENGSTNVSDIRNSSENDSENRPISDRKIRNKGHRKEIMKTRRRALRSSNDDADSDSLLSSNMRKKTKPRATKSANTSNESQGESDSEFQEGASTSRAAMKRRQSDDSEQGEDADSNKEGSDSDFVQEEAKDGSSGSEAMSKSRKRKSVKRRLEASGSDDEDDSDGNKKKKRKRKRIRVQNSDSSEDDDQDDNGNKKKGRKNIRKVLKNKDLEEDTKLAAREEQERKKRIEERQKKYNTIYDGELKEIKELTKLVLDFDDETKEELLMVDKNLVRKLKPHQAVGVKFMWDACFESIGKIEEDHPGSGCILAHCMGLGKTLQVVTLIHTLLANCDETKVERVLVICPVSTILNWVNEFKIWLRHCESERDIGIYEISKYKQNIDRAGMIKEWHEEGGVMILGYDMFRNLSNETTRIRKKQREIFQTALINPGADLVVCDEGHLLKNAKTSLSKAVNRIQTRRRIVLTGTPLQNNLNEYYCMVQFVKPNLLGKYNEYLNRFVNPITNGQYTDSTPRDIQMMKRRSHILHNLLDGCVQRKDYSVLAPFLPPKQEYVVYIRLTPIQCELYKYYMDNRPARDTTQPTRSSVLFADFQNLQRIWTHPRVLRYNSDRYEINARKKRDLMDDDEEGSLKDFIDDDDEGDSDMSSSNSERSFHSTESDSDKKSTKQVRRTRANAKDIPEPEVEITKEENPTEWWMSLCPEEELDNLEHSGKLMLLFSILADCEAIGDKLLVFSQSLYSLDVIEHFLSLIDDNTRNPNPDAKFGGYTGSWSQGMDYFRLDGSTNIENRNLACQHFNSESNTRARLFLISTRAGGLGINLVAANRVVIFDVSWNPSHDIQSIFRVYRFGQKKPCYIYRFIALGTMEEKIYERQVTKLAISKRVIDEHQIDRHYKETDLMELYKVDIEPEEPPPLLNVPKDKLFAEQLHSFKDRLYKYHEHDSLLENKSEETLTADEIRAAWEEFEAEKTRPQVQAAYVNYTYTPRQQGTGPVTSNQIYGFRTDILLQLLNIRARKEYPDANQQSIAQIVPLLLKHLYETMDKNDTSFYHELLTLQATLENPYVAQTNFNNPGSSNNIRLNPFAAQRGPQPVYPSIIEQQNRFINAQTTENSMRSSTVANPNPVIEID